MILARGSGVPKGRARVLPAPEASALPAAKTQSRSSQRWAEGGEDLVSRGRVGLRALEEGGAHGNPTAARTQAPGSAARKSCLLSGRWPQPPGPWATGKSSPPAGRAVGVMSEEPADAGFEGAWRTAPARLWFLLLPRPLLPP